MQHFGSRRSSLFMRQRHIAQQGPYLIQPWTVIGDTIFALEVSERIWQRQPEATIDLLCTEVQMQVLADHPRMKIVPLGELASQSSHLSTGYILPIPKDFYADHSESMRQKRQIYAAHLMARRYITAFIEDPQQFKMLFREGQQYTHRSLRLLHFQAIAEKMLPLPRSFWRDIPKYIGAREMVDHYFGILPSQKRDTGQPVSLYLASHRIAKAARRAAEVKQHAGRPDGILLLVNADTSSPVTRPPTDLLVLGIREVLDRNTHVVVGILHGYTCPEAHEQLHQELKAHYGRRICYVASDTQPEHLLDTVALIDQADIFLTGDTGLMHLAATKKITIYGTAPTVCARNHTAIISLWGGTRPGYWGYPGLMTMVGEGNALQRQMYPGIRKYTWRYKQQAYFEHIHPADVAKAIVAALTQRKTGHPNHAQRVHSCSRSSTYRKLYQRPY